MNQKDGLSKSAYQPVPEGETFQSYVPASESPAEFTLKAAISGMLFGILFGAANAYLGLRAGLTISTSIPVAVMTVAAFRMLRSGGIQSSILEANLSQTIGSASSSLASGIIFTLPALFLWHLDPGLLQMTLLALCGGLLGVCFMIPLRRYLIAREHGKLPYPEGTACAEVLVASQVGGGRARRVFTGLGIGAFFKLLAGGIRIFPDSFQFSIPFLKRAEVSCEASAALFGVGYILGPRVSMVMVGGGLLSSLVLIPVIAIWGEGRTEPFYPETVQLISEMSASRIWTRYIRYIGAGAVAGGGLLTLIKSLPVMMESFKVGASQLKGRLESGHESSGVPRTEQDLPLGRVALGVGMVALGMAAIPQIFQTLGSFPARLLASLLVTLFAFFFVTVSSRIVGLVGVTSNPTSGMTIASLLGVASVFLFLGWTDDLGKAATISIGCVIAIAASIAGDTSQDLKTGFILGATPRRQQIGEVIGVLTSAIFVCATVLLLHQKYGFGSQELAAPQATLMKLVVEGVLENSLPWSLVGIGIAIALFMELIGVQSLAFAVGVYLPLSTTFPVFLGGALCWLLARGAASTAEADARKEKGVLLGSGLVAGEGLLGVGVAAAAYFGASTQGFGWAWAGDAAQWISIGALAILIGYFARDCSRE